MIAILTFTTGGSAQDLAGQLQLAQRQNWYLRALSGDSVLATGRVRRVGAAAVEIGGTAVDVSAIGSLERRVDSGGGFLGGALVGGTAGAWFGAGLAGLCDNNCPRHAELRGALIFAGIGALLGGVAGQLVAPPKHRWQVVWP